VFDMSFFPPVFRSISISNSIHCWRHVIRRQTRANYASTRRATKPRFGVGARGRTMVMREGHGLTHEEETCTDTWDKRSRRWCLRPQDRVSTVCIKRNLSLMRGKWLRYFSGILHRILHKICIHALLDAFAKIFSRCINDKIMWDSSFK